MPVAGVGYGNPEQKADLQHERQAELAEELHRDDMAGELAHAAREAHAREAHAQEAHAQEAHAREAHAPKRAPWWKRLFRG
jgi:hypothetical protein